MAFDGACQIRRALMMGTGVAQLDLQADDGTFTWHWYVSSTSNAQQMLAVALTAIATNKHVWATINDPTQALSQVINLGLVK
jgi:hypothetical protein